MNQAFLSSTTRLAHLVTVVHLQGVGVPTIVPPTTAPVLLKGILAVGLLPIVVQAHRVEGRDGEIGKRLAWSMLLSECDVHFCPRTTTCGMLVHQQPIV
jgi:hypothetical protein